MPKPCYKKFPDKIETVGDHIRQRRLKLNKSQSQISKTLGITPDTLCLWETNQKKPQDRFMPAIISFLGYNPIIQNPETTGEELKKWRLENGISIKKLTKLLYMDRQTILRIESDSVITKPSSKKKIRVFLKKKRWLFTPTF